MPGGLARVALAGGLELLVEDQGEGEEIQIRGRDLVNGEVHVKFKPISGSVDQAAGLVWRYQDEDNYYIVRANALEDNVVLYKVQGGKRTDRRGQTMKHDFPSPGCWFFPQACKGFQASGHPL